MLKISQRYFVLSKAFRDGSLVLFRDNAQPLSRPLRSAAQFRPFMSSHLNRDIEDAQFIREFTSNDSTFTKRSPDGKGKEKGMGTVRNGYGVKQLPNGLYEGHFKDGRLCGEGKITYSDGTTLAGDFKYGLIWNGSGIQKASNGNTYEGEIIEGKRSGPTKITYADGSVYDAVMKEGQLWGGAGKILLRGGHYYIGEVRDGGFHGNGKIYYHDNNTYLEGEFRWGKLWNVELRKVPDSSSERSDKSEQDTKYVVLKRWVSGTYVHGRGGAVGGVSSSSGLDSINATHAERVVLPDGSVLEGEWREDVFFGTQTSPDGKVMTGQFADGKIWNGTGEMYLENGAVYEGAVQAGRLWGLAKVTYPDGRSQVGRFMGKGRLMHGSGAFRLENGDIYQGQISHGQFSGRGKLIFAGDSYMLEGEFRKGRLWNGIGRLRHPNGSVYEGEFKEGQRHGQGKVTYDDGGSHEGEFREGKLWEGCGIVKVNSDEVYQGEIKEGKFNGQGMLSMVGEVVRGEFKDGNIWNGERVLRDGRVTQRWVEGISDGATLSAAKVERASEQKSESGRVDEQRGEHGHIERRTAYTFVEDEIVSELSLEALWSKVEKLRGGRAGQDLVGRKDDQIFTTPVPSVTGGFYSKAGVGTGAGTGTQVTFPDARLPDVSASKPDRITVAVDPELDAAEFTVGDDTSKRTSTGQGASTSKAARDLRTSETATEANRGGRKNRWMDLHTEPPASFVAVTAADILASRNQRFVTADHTVLEGAWHGKRFVGKQTYSDGRVEEGEFVDDKLHGQGKITYPDGRSLEGHFQEGELWEGVGVLEFQTGDSYEGEIAKGKMHGQGQLMYPAGGWFKGEFRNGQAWTGSGIKCLREGATVHKLTGEFKDGRLWNGVGFLKFKSGGSYEGEFKEGKMHGQGTNVLPDGRLQVGEFKEGQFMDTQSANGGVN